VTTLRFFFSFMASLWNLCFETFIFKSILFRELRCLHANTREDLRADGDLSLQVDWPWDV